MTGMRDGSQCTFAFGRFRFDSSTGELWRDGHAVRIAPKPASVLTLLLESAGELVTRQTIESEVWGDQPIDLDRSVNFAIRQIRSALGDAADAPVYVETLPRRGYRFIAPAVRTDGASAADATTPTSGPAEDVRHKSRPGHWPVAATVVIAATVAALAAPSIAAVIERGPESTPATGQVETIAVLPFEHLAAGDSDEYFAAGLSGELITLIARLDPTRLKVIAPSSARRVDALVASDSAVAEALSARYLLRGSVTRADDGIRVGVRLVDATDETLLWANRYLVAAPSTPALEYDIAIQVADALGDRIALGVPDLPGPGTTDPAARTAYLEGSWLLGQGQNRLDDAIAALERAVAADSGFAAPRTSLARALVMRGRRAEAREQLRIAVRLAPRSADAHVALGVDALYTLWDMDRARAHFEEAIAVDPGNVLAHHPYAYFLSIAGRHEEAISEIEEALRLDPVSPLVNGDVGRIYYRAGRFDEAMRICQRTLDLQHDHPTALSCLINIHTLRGEPELALRYATRTLGPGEAGDHARRALNARAPDAAMRSYFERRVERLQRSADQGRDVHAQIAQALVFLGRPDEAIDHLELALAMRSPVLPQVPGDPCFATLAIYPRFQAIVKAMGLGLDTA